MFELVAHGEAEL